MAATGDVCPHCCSALKFYEINLEEGLEMCSNVKCHYPFAEKDPDIIVVKLTPSDNFESKNFKKEENKDFVNTILKDLEFTKDAINVNENTPTKQCDNNNDNAELLKMQKAPFSTKPHDEIFKRENSAIDSDKKVFFFEKFISKR